MNIYIYITVKYNITTLLRNNLSVDYEYALFSLVNIKYRLVARQKL